MTFKQRNEQKALYTYSDACIIETRRDGKLLVQWL